MQHTATVLTYHLQQSLEAMGISLSQMTALETLPWGQLRYCFLVTVTELPPLTPELLSIGPAAMCQAELASPSGNLCGFSCPTEVPNLASVLRAFQRPPSL